MMSKLNELRELRRNFDIKINGLDNYSLDVPNLIVANHSCLMDVFFLPMACPEDVVSLISPRLIYKKDKERQKMINKYLYSMPIEAHGGKKYSDLCISFASDLLCSGCSSIIFPEGAYVEGGTVYRGRTGATRILYNSRKLGVASNLLPVAIDVTKSNIDLDSYSLNEGQVEITFLPPVDYTDYYYSYISSDNNFLKNEMLHRPIDISLSLIASVLGREYCNEYIELYPKKNVIFENGETIPTNIALDNYYISLYTAQLEKRKEKILLKK